MTKFFRFLPLVLVVVLMASCQKEVSFNDANLIGMWQEENKQVFFLFTTELDSTTNSRIACKWDEAEDVTYSDRLEARQKLGHLCNGWFTWFVSGSELNTTNYMDNGGADIPKLYTIMVLTESELQYQDNYKQTHKFNKVVDKK